MDGALTSSWGDRNGLRGSSYFRRAGSYIIGIRERETYQTFTAKRGRGRERGKSRNSLSSKDSNLPCHVFSSAKCDTTLELIQLVTLLLAVR